MDITSVIKLSALPAMPVLWAKLIIFEINDPRSPALLRAKFPKGANAFRTSQATFAIPANIFTPSFTTLNRPLNAVLSASCSGTVNIIWCVKFSSPALRSFKFFAVAAGNISSHASFIGPITVASALNRLMNVLIRSCLPPRSTHP